MLAQSRKAYFWQERDPAITAQRSKPTARMFKINRGLGYLKDGSSIRRITSLRYPRVVSRPRYAKPHNANRILC